MNMSSRSLKNVNCPIFNEILLCGYHKGLELLKYTYGQIEDGGRRQKKLQNWNLAAIWANLPPRITPLIRQIYTCIRGWVLD